MKAKHYIPFLMALLSWNIYAQQPSHFVLGEDELAGVDIYDLHQDKCLNYWIASNNGIYKFDGYDINHIDCDGMLSSSIFNFIENEVGTVYCHNLNGQIFKIQNDSCSVYYTIPDSLMNHEISINFDDVGRLIVFTKHIFEITKNLEIKILYSKELGDYNFILKTNRQKLMLYNVFEKELITISQGKINRTSIDLYTNLVSAIFIELNNKTTAFDRRSGAVLKALSDSVSYELPILNGNGDYFRYYSDKNSLWIGNLTGGAHYYKDSSYFHLPNKLIFESTILSSFLIDNEENTLFGTFGKGIIVVPNKNFVDIDLEKSKSEVMKITKTKNGSIILGTQLGEVIKIDSNNITTKLVNRNFKRIEILEYLPNEDKILFNGQSNMLLDERFKKQTYFIAASLKDITNYKNKNYLVCTNVGLYVYNKISNRLNTPAFYKGRTYAVSYDSINETIYYSTAAGLKIGTTQKANFFKLNNNDVMSNDIQFFEKSIYVSTSRNGVLVFKNDTLIDNWNESKGLLSNNVKQIKYYNDKFYVATNKGINIVSKTGKVLKYLNKSNGLNAINIVDFDIVNDELWIVTNKGVQKIRLSEIKNKHFTPNIQITSIEVNNDLIDTNVHEFEYTDDMFVFEIASKSLKYRNSIYYEYQLVGVDKTWVKSTFDNHIFEYKSLAPNAYTFKIRAVYDTNYSETVYYNFVIKKPFWLKSGFYAILIVFFLMSMFTILNFQIRKQKKKILIENQLSKTQLTALKSQMNPHFIFNSLNSIQDLILQQDRENAYNYISKFALLVRKILFYSDKEFIDFEEEINVLQVYLELEELRFKRDFKFNINTNEISDIEIPPMLIQPFVENALKHGLLHKKGHKTININFIFENEVLKCEIIDNGIGRKKSDEIKARQNKSHKSFSVKSIQTRFDILKDLYGENVSVNIIDLVENNEGIGTKVILNIPFKRFF